MLAILPCASAFPRGPVCAALDQFLAADRPAWNFRDRPSLQSPVTRPWNRPAAVAFPHAPPHSWVAFRLPRSPFLAGPLAMVHLLYHSGQVMYLLAFLVRDMLWLRVLIVVAQTLLMPFFYCDESGEPCWEPLAWGSLTIAINVVQITILLLQRNPVFLGEAELKLYRSKFRTLRVRDFMKLMAIAQWHRGQQTEAIIKQGDIVHQLWLLTDGLATVEVDQRRVTDIGAGEFVGEMSLLTGEPASATVMAHPGIEYVAWEAKDLRGLFASRPDMEGKFRAVLGADLVQKLRRVSEAAAHPSRMMDARKPQS